MEKTTAIATTTRKNNVKIGNNKTLKKQREKKIGYIVRPALFEFNNNRCDRKRVNTNIEQYSVAVINRIFRFDFFFLNYNTI